MSDKPKESHEPLWYQQGQLRIHEKQRNCWGFHAPEDKKKHALCDRCTVEIFQQMAALERDRAASFVESLGYPELAERVRNLK